MGSVQVKFNQAKFLDAMNTLKGVRNGFERAVQGAISRVLTTARQRIGKTLLQEVNLRLRDIKDQITLKRPSFKNLKGAVNMSRKPVPLANYLSNRQKTAGSKKPLTVKVRKRQPLARYPDTVKKAFVGAGIAPFIGVFQRTGVKRKMKKGMYKGKRREVIRRLYGPTAIGVFANAKGEQAATLVDDELQDMGADLDKYLAQRVDYLLNHAKSAT